MTTVAPAQTMTIKELETQLLAGNVTIAPSRMRETETFTLPIIDQQGQATGTQDIVIGVERQNQVNGFVNMYDTRIGEPVPVDINRVQLVLKKTHQDKRFPEWVGRRKYTLDAESAPVYKMGTQKCLLHPDSPDYEHFVSLGAEPCRKANIPNLMAVEEHFRKKHATIYKRRQDERDMAIQAEEREFRQLQIADMRLRQQGTSAEQPTMTACPMCQVDITTGRGPEFDQQLLRTHIEQFHSEPA